MKKCLLFPNKKRYNTKKEAELAVILLNSKNIRIYKCDCCNGWHLTSLERNLHDF